MPPAAIFFRVFILFFIIAFAAILIYILAMYLLTGRIINVFSKVDSWHQKDEARGFKRARDNYSDAYDDIKDMYKKRKGR